MAAILCQPHYDNLFIPQTHVTRHWASCHVTRAVVVIWCLSVVTDRQNVRTERTNSAVSKTARHHLNTIFLSQASLEVVILTTSSTTSDKILWIPSVTVTITCVHVSVVIEWALHACIIYSPVNIKGWLKKILNATCFELHCPACRTTLVAARFRVAVICPIIQVPHCIRVFFSFVLFVFINHIFNFIMNYVPIVTFWIFTYHKIWILSIMFCFIWSYWIIYFLACLEVSWGVVS